MSKFITSNNTDNIKHTKQIICIEANEKKDNIFSIEEEEKYFYQMDFKFISGRDFRKRKCNSTRGRRIYIRIRL